jgi:methylated-DNA-protein-cysteine methyltransferase related protein
MKANPPKSNERLRRIWQVIRRVPAGAVITYGDVAEIVDVPCTARQVGQALRLATPGLRLPWHRVLAAGGRIAIPGDGGIEQRLRLESEGVAFAGRRVRMDLHQYRQGKGRRPSGRNAAAVKTQRGKR